MQRGLQRFVSMALRALTAGYRSGRSQAIGSLTRRSLLGVRGFASTEQQVCAVGDEQTMPYVFKVLSIAWSVSAGCRRPRRRPWRIRLCDQSSSDGYEGHLYRRTWQVGWHLSQHRMHSFQGKAVTCSRPPTPGCSSQDCMCVCRHF